MGSVYLYYPNLAEQKKGLFYTCIIHIISNVRARERERTWEMKESE